MTTPKAPDQGPMPSDQIMTVQDADDYLTGLWKDPARYSQAELDRYRRSERLELARMWINEGADN